MNKHSNKLIPELRFPEFRDAEEWKEDVLGGKGISSFVKERIPLAKLKLESYVSTENLLPDYAGVTAASKLPPAGSFTRFRKDDILISNIRPYLKKVWSSNMDGAASNDVIVIRADSIISESFLSFLLINDDFINYVMKGAKGVKMPRGDKSLMEKYPIAFPTKYEQQKIADCLSSIDNLISAQGQKLDALKAHKKGLMQQLFPAEGETVPKLRFAEFRDEGEWEEKALGNLGEFTGGGTPSKANDSFWKGSISWVSSSDIFEDSIHQIKISRFITEEALKDSATKLVPGNSILLVSRVGVGKLAISKQPVCTSQDFTNFTPDKDNLMFLAYILKSHSKTLLEYSQGMAIKGFTKDDISKLKMFIPNPDEQQKIADCLSSIDDLITAQSQKLNALKVHKKGLMQQLFPQTSEL